ncbi:hypothetical protein [Cohnella panacarvi]|uniref:hypothetical protein n=1 Tax=Cohnella panacarvi TaxID=400776 RepID=UPI0004AC7182|nr:hypothetical protein [Cohnella panacarvi]
MKEGDAEANYAYYALHELHILPHELMRMNRYEQAAIYAMIDERVQAEKRKMKSAKRR